MEKLQMRNDGENIIIKMSSPEMAEKVMRLYNYANFLEITEGVDVPQEEIDKLADEINESAHQARLEKNAGSNVCS